MGVVSPCWENLNVSPVLAAPEVHHERAGPFDLMVRFPQNLEHSGRYSRGNRGQCALVLVDCLVWCAPFERKGYGLTRGYSVALLANGGPGRGFAVAVY